MALCSVPDGRYGSLRISPWFHRTVAERTIQLAHDHGQFVHFKRASTVLASLSGESSSTVRYRASGHGHRLVDCDVLFVTFDDLAFLFTAYLIGNAVAAAVFGLELCVKNVRLTVSLAPQPQPQQQQ